MNTNALVTYHDSKSPVFAAVNAGLDSFRVVSESIQPHVRAILATVKGEDAAAESIRADLLNLPVVLAGLGLTSLESLLDPETILPAAGDLGYTISTLGVRGIQAVTAEGKTEARNGLAGLAIYPAWSVDALLGADNGKEWIQRIADKEMGLVAFRPIRSKPGETTLAELEEGARQIPLTAGDFTTPTTTESGQFDLFKELWVPVRDLLKNEPTPVGQLMSAVAGMKRDDVLNSIRSQTYADRLFPALEGVNAFVNVARVFHHVVAAKAAKEAEDPESTFRHDPAIILRWIENRDTLDLLPKAVTVDSDLGNFDLAAFIGG